MSCGFPDFVPGPLYLKGRIVVIAVLGLVQSRVGGRVGTPCLSSGFPFAQQFLEPMISSVVEHYRYVARPPVVAEMLVSVGA